MWHRVPALTDGQRTTVTIVPMCFSTGQLHPLASRPELKVSVSVAAADDPLTTEVIGDYILYWVRAPISSDTEEKISLCGIYLIAWKEGWTSEVCQCPTVISVKIQNRLVLLASHLPSGRVRLALICAIRGDCPADSTARTSTGAVPTIEHWGP
jgi:hypothetical protein